MAELPLYLISLTVILIEAIAGAFLGLWRLPAPLWRPAERLVGALHPAPPVTGRSIECVSAHARRLNRAFHEPDAGRARAKLDGTRMAYDHVLAEACGLLGIEHLLGVLEVGPELDGERRRVESRLISQGFQLTT